MAESNHAPASEDPRVRFAGERTMLAWTRTGLAMMGFGFVVARFGVFLHELSNTGQAGRFQYSSISLWIGAGLIVLGVAIHVISAFEYARFLRRVTAGEPYQPPRWSLAIMVALALAIIGMAMVTYLVTLPTAP